MSDPTPLPRSAQSSSAARVLDGLTANLWAERQLLLDVRSMLRTLWLIMQTESPQSPVNLEEQIDVAIERLHVREVLCAVDSEWLATNYGLTPPATLSELVEVVPQPWGLILREHQRYLRGVVADVEAMKRRLERLLDGPAVLASGADSAVTSDGTGDADPTSCPLRASAAS